MKKTAEMIIIYIVAIIMKEAKTLSNSNDKKNDGSPNLSGFEVSDRQVRIGGLNITDERVRIGNAVDIDGKNEKVRLGSLVVDGKNSRVYLEKKEPQLPQQQPPQSFSRPNTPMYASGKYAAGQKGAGYPVPQKQPESNQPEPYNNDGREYKLVPSPWPFVFCGGFWLLYALFFPLYAWYHIAICGALSYGVYNIFKGIFPPKRVEVIKPYVMPQSTDEAFNQTITSTAKLLESIGESSKKISPKSPSLASNADSLIRRTKMILEYLAENPHKASLVRRLFNYYLPTLDKLLKSWQLFDEHGEGDGEWAGKPEIEEAVAEMENVFRKQHDKLINDAALDISAEIDVLEKMLDDQISQNNK